MLEVNKKQNSIHQKKRYHMQTGQNNAIKVRQNEEIEIGQLNEYLKLQNIEIEQINTIKQFPGGYSNLTYLVETTSKNYVLRRPPFGAKDIKGGHDMEREFKLLKAVEKAGFSKIPKPIFFSDENNFLEAPFYLMEKVEGLIFRASDAKSLLAYPAELFQKASQSLCDNLVALHDIDIEKTELINIGKPDGYIKRQVEGWTKRYEKAQTDDISNIDDVSKWLIEKMPAENKPTLIHNDYKYDNVVLDPENLSEIRAILDWEMTTVGDPLMDLGTTMSYWSEKTDEGFEKNFNITWLEGNLNREEFVARYAEKSGRDTSNILYYYVFGLFKNSVVMQQIYARFKKGLTNDPRFGSLILGVHRLSEKAAISITENKMA